MNHEPNTHQWARGQICVHDADAKEPKMLMVIKGYTRQGLAKCQYCDNRRSRRIMPNGIEFLHKPERFGLLSEWGNFSQEALERVQLDWERVRIWNVRHAIGTWVQTTSADGGFETVTTSTAYMQGHEAMIWLARGGLWSLRFVEVIHV